jgi:hypothetical protein
MPLKSIFIYSKESKTDELRYCLDSEFHYFVLTSNLDNECDVATYFEQLKKTFFFCLFVCLFVYLFACFK